VTKAVVPVGPTSRDDVIRADLARGVSVQALAEEWGLSAPNVARIGAGIPALPPAPEPELTGGQDLVVRTGGGRLINPFDPGLPDPDERRDPRAAEYHRERLSESTRYAYRRFIGQYLDFCALTGRREVPANRFTVEAFAIWLAERPVTRGKNKGKTGLAPLSIGVALSAVRALHVAVGENPPDRELARGIVERHTKRRAKDRDIHDGVGSPAVDLPTFTSLVESCPPDTNAGLRDRAMLTLGLNIMARRSELCILDVADITIDRDGWLQVYIHETKTGKPRTVLVPPWDDLPELCPKRAWLAWRARLVEHGLGEGPAFRGIDRWDHIQGAGAWAGRAQLGNRLNGADVEHLVARAALRAAVPNGDDLSPHGVLRRTGATLSYASGADVLAIARQGGWHEQSPVVFQYITTVDLKKRNPMLLIGRDGG
jgi:hypothetical protein